MTLTTELKTLADCERIIEDGLKSFCVVGIALLEIRDNRLYKEAGYSAFEEYVSKRWDGMSKSRAYQLIDSSIVSSNLSTIVDTPEPSSESQIRPLVRLEPEIQREVWKEATAAKLNPTAKEVQAAFERVTKSAPKPVAIDPLFQVWLLKTISTATIFLKKTSDKTAAMEIQQIIDSAKLLIEITA